MSNIPLSITVDGVDFANDYTSCEVEKALDSFAHRFSIVVPGDLGVLFATTGVEVVISRGSEILVTGYVNRVRQSFSSRELSTSIEGRSATADLVDCSATHKTGTWLNKNARAIIADICEPFGIFVDTTLDDATLKAAGEDTFPRFSIEPGETAFATIDRICKVRGLLPITRADGALLLVRKIKGLDSLATKKITPQPGVIMMQRQLSRSRILSHERTYDESERHSSYASPTHMSAPQDASHRITVTDGGVERWRPIIIIPDAPQTPVETLNRLNWEKNVRIGRTERFRFTVSGTGWTDQRSFVPGDEYVLPDLFKEDYGADLALNREMLPTSLLERSVIRVSSTEAVCELEFVNPLAYSLESDSTVNAAGLTKSKTKPKLIVHKTRKKGQTR